MQRRTVWSTPVLYAAVVSCSLLWACGEKKEMGPKELQAIQMVKAYTPEGTVFSVISNIEKMAEDDGRKGEKWEIPADAWKAGFPTQKDHMLEVLSQYFTVFRPSGDYWVSFSYKDASGAHQGMWDVNIYTKKIVPKNDVALKCGAPPTK
ncbi:MAG: hypothetical protein HYZ50_00820 [Deltaproteobacteria bacterium]|nr:hypothetical protein [Deltaproteobacteria bacterium]